MMKKHKFLCDFMAVLHRVMLNFTLCTAANPCAADAMDNMPALFKRSNGIFGVDGVSWGLFPLNDSADSVNIRNFPPSAAQMPGATVPHK
ncbi:hypothetical protein MIZ03_0123 [Rhodoferax lithotrophicus]|uniref:Uncharacterized protein n=2 Tax=Rhodoferax lithotrophicus TaxID=2798804 RepID=A0ABN6D0W6_9BURK|nr:hypothetical protein MIZ03_0123 [Rhodoferax sp. MIZ03]